MIQPKYETYETFMYYVIVMGAIYSVHKATNAQNVFSFDLDDASLSLYFFNTRQRNCSFYELVSPHSALRYDKNQKQNLNQPKLWHIVREDWLISLLQLFVI